MSNYFRSYYLLAGMYRLGPTLFSIFVMFVTLAAGVALATVLVPLRQTVFLHVLATSSLYKFIYIHLVHVHMYIVLARL